MDLALGEEQRLIAEAATEFLAEACDSRAMRAAAESEAGFDRALWRQIAEQGWCGVQAPESAGGMGLGWVELALLQEQLGRRLACVPYFDSVVLSASLLRASGSAGEALLGEVVTGAKVVVASFEGGAATLRASADGNWVLDGAWSAVSCGAWADRFLLCAHDEHDGGALLSVPAASVEVRPLHTIDATRRRADLAARHLAVPASACLLRGDAVPAAIRGACDRAALGLAAEQLGIAQQCLDLSVAYTMQRVQFGRTIAHFQAVKHRCALMLVAIEAARSAVYGAAAVADAAPDAATLAFHAAQALCAASDAAQYCAQEAIQLHGGVGYTAEYDPQLCFKRAQANSVRLGSPTFWRERIAVQLLDAAA